tara:strand:+ start:808 stop:999 length:192 start_codon:yes stop_codon:yes gene_type:complete
MNQSVILKTITKRPSVPYIPYTKTPTEDNHMDLYIYISIPILEGEAKYGYGEIKKMERKTIRI